MAQNVNGSGRLLSDGIPDMSNTNHPPAVAESPFSHLPLPLSRSSATSNVGGAKAYFRQSVPAPRQNTAGVQPFSIHDTS